MRPFIILLTLTWICQQAMAQSPDRLSYQAIVRNASGNVVSNQSVGMRITILKGSATGTSVYVETQTRTTSASGLITLEIGGGTPVTGSFATVNWGQGPYFIKTEMDVAGGTNYQLTATTQLLSVPYSLYAQSAALKYSASGDTLFSGKEYVIVPGLSTANSNAVVTGSPSVITSVASSVTTVSAAMGGEVISIGASAVTARGVCYGTSASPTVANNTVASGSGLGAFSLTIPGLNPATTYYARAYATNGTGTSYGNQVAFTTQGAAGQACAQGSTLTVTHTAGSVAPVTKTVTYKLVQTNLSGESKCWIAQNLGADRQAVASDDFSESSAGWYWQFNRKQGYSHDGVFTRTPNSAWITNINEDMNWMPSNDPCSLLLGSGWRIPLNMEWSRVNVNGSFFFGGNQYNFFSSAFRIHAAGYLKSNDGVIYGRGIDGLFWSSNQGTTSSAYFYSIYTFNGGGVNNYSFEKSFGNSVRCIKD
jgi:uncharacterized protein (TIGR02145 family)